MFLLINSANWQKQNFYEIKLILILLVVRNLDYEVPKGLHYKATYKQGSNLPILLLYDSNLKVISWGKADALRGCINNYLQ